MNILRGLVEQHVLSKKQAQAILSKALAQTSAARGGAGTAAPQAAQAAAAPPPGTVMVPYVPDNVREDIENKVKSEVLADEESHNYARPNEVPEWTKRIHVFGDVRFRDQENLFDKNNATTFVNIPAINAASTPVDQNAGPFPVLNSTQNRNMLRVRARLGVEADINDDTHVVIRLATGSDNGPVSTNQTLGGGFTKKAIWLDRGYIDWSPIDNLSLIFGRQDNPFRSTEIVWKQDDLALDGVSASFAPKVTSELGAFLTLGAYPLSYTPDDFPTNAPSSAKVNNSLDKWLFAGQIGGDYTPDTVPRLTLSGSAAYYYYLNAEGKQSACVYTDAFCDTDFTRPPFAQKGNTYIPLRPDITNPITGAMPEYYGLASKFHVFDLLGRADYAVSDDLHLILTGDYAKNFGFDRKAILAEAGGVGGLANNNETCVLPPGVSLAPGQSCTAGGGTNVFKSGDTAWLMRIGVGAPETRELWQWNAKLAYLYIEPDAVLDAFDDSDFRLGGTNSKGWILEGDLGVGHNAWLTAKWLSADVVSGPPFSVDVLQLDLNTKF